MKECENCHILCEGWIGNGYGSGRFCSEHCSRSFSSKINSKEKNEKIRKTLTGRGHKNVILICANCNKEFEIKWTKRFQKTCSRSCSCKLRFKDPEEIEKMSNSSIRAHIDGKIKPSLKSKRCHFYFNGEYIRCDSKVEYACLDYFVTKMGAIHIERCKFSINYIYNVKNKKYLPDFIIKTHTITYVVECKCYFKITEDVKNSKSWNMYYGTIEPKKECLKKYCIENGFVDFFFTKYLHRKFYDTCKII